MSSVVVKQEPACRICGCTGRSLFNVFDSRLSGSKFLLSMIILSTGIEIKEDDVVSKWVCYKCCRIVVKLYTYRTTAIANDESLKKQCGQPCVPPLTNNDEIVHANNIIFEKNRSLRQSFGFPSRERYGNSNELYDLDKNIFLALSHRTNDVTDPFDPNINIKKEKESSSRGKSPRQFATPTLSPKTNGVGSAITNSMVRVTPSPTMPLGNAKLRVTPSPILPGVDAKTRVTPSPTMPVMDPRSRVTPSPTMPVLGRKSRVTPSPTTSIVDPRMRVTSSPTMPVLTPQGSHVSREHILKSRVHFSIKNICRKYTEIKLPHDLLLTAHLAPEIYLDSDEVSEWLAQHKVQLSQKPLKQACISDYLTPSAQLPAQSTPQQTSDLILTLPAKKPKGRLPLKLTRPKTRVSYAEEEVGFTDEDTDDDRKAPVVHSNRVIDDEDEASRMKMSPPKTPNNPAQSVTNGVVQTGPHSRVNDAMPVLQVINTAKAKETLQTPPKPSATVSREGNIVHKSNLPALSPFNGSISMPVVEHQLASDNRRGTARKKTTGKAKLRKRALYSDSFSEVIPARKVRVYSKPGPKPHNKVELPLQQPLDKDMQKTIFTSSLELTTNNASLLLPPNLARLPEQETPISRDLLFDSGKADCVYECTLCCKILDTKAQLTQHEKIHFTCTHCSKTVENMDLMKKHLNQECVTKIVRNQPFVLIERVDESKDTVGIYKKVLERMSSYAQVPMKDPFEVFVEALYDNAPVSSNKPIEEIVLPPATSDLLDECNNGFLDDSSNEHMSAFGESSSDEKHEGTSANSVVEKDKVEFPKTVSKRRKSVSVKSGARVLKSNASRALPACAEAAVNAETLPTPPPDVSPVTALSAQPAIEKDNILALFKKYTHPSEKRDAESQTFYPTDSSVEITPAGSIVLRNGLNDLLYFKIPIEMKISSKIGFSFSSPKKDSLAAVDFKWDNIKPKLITVKHLRHVECIDLVDDAPALPAQYQANASSNTVSVISSSDKAGRPPTIPAKGINLVNTTKQPTGALLTSCQSPNVASDQVRDILMRKLIPPTSSFNSLIPNKQTSLVQQSMNSGAAVLPAVYDMTPTTYMNTSNSTAVLPSSDHAYSTVMPTSGTFTLNAANVIPNVQTTFMSDLSHFSQLFTDSMGSTPLYTINTTSAGQLPIVNTVQQMPVLSTINQSQSVISNPPQLSHLQVQNNITNILMVQDNIPCYLRPPQQQDSSVVIEEITETLPQEQANSKNDRQSPLCDEALSLQSLLESAHTKPPEGIRVKSLAELIKQS